MIRRLIFSTLFVAVAFWQKTSASCSTKIPGDQLHTSPAQFPLGGTRPNIYFSKSWQVLGPFRIGTREAVWGADPLEYQGGFSNLPYDEDAKFSSALAPNGTVQWGVLGANNTSPMPDQSRTELIVRFPEVDWTFLQSVYGWSALQYQAWVRGYLQLNELTHQTIAIFTDGILELIVDGKGHFGGDFYSYHSAPLILDLAPGEHVIELRLIRDVRAMGGLGEPTVQVVLEAEIRRESLSIDERSLLVPETTNRKLGSVQLSINVQSNVAECIQVLSVSSSEVPLVMETAIITISNSAPGVLVSPEGTLRTLSFLVELVEKSLSQPQRLTYLHPAGIVSYAILRPPPLNSVCTDQQNNSMPVIVALHGAGLEADNKEVREMLDAAYGVCAWMLFPSGVTSWSGDDWHTWGVADVKAAINAVSQWITAVGWTGPGISSEDWIVVGHSNGGQGAWFLATHYPDNVIAVAPVSGYSSIENYVPYSVWRDSEPLLSAVLQRSRSSFKHESLLENIGGIPILQQHGSNDTNVPVYHSRLMHELLGEVGWSSEYNELPGKGHWYAGLMTTPSLLDFYESSLVSLPLKTPLAYTLIIPSSGDVTSKGGIYVDQLQSPDINGLLKVSKDTENGVWLVKTRNVHRFHLTATVCQTQRPVSLVLDDTPHRFEVDPDQCNSTWYVKNSEAEWTSSRQSGWQHLSQRYGRQVGAMDAILRTWGVFTIVTCSANIDHIALQISRNLLQYFNADSRITSQCPSITTTGLPGQSTIPGNVITLAIGDSLPSAALSSFPIRINERKVFLFQRSVQFDPDQKINLDIAGKHPPYTYDYEQGLGALFLRPLENEALELVVWGADLYGLEQAARLVPTLTGAGQPEFLILGDSCRWKGHAGLYAAGHLDKFWQISPGSYVNTDR
ncbi:hypothetical protein ARAM_000727 [Aspergillus rambellii]|uniref:Peptidase S9 prolyl oligopeptidase catalytic domain-containing protein n=1 Tax=Aspergillus rambellii TaxID=308745 RepID=A0A0F8WXI3_9EURO|nr:hypothetical protein ARAM_000727 [Aspergillus rambellii]